ncbi:hypothetical protein A0H81_06076 [Grifola frondosa]|uniref:Uncharacterized protein n=1 Tax=Grifola frondosa TaxID=5627 RepID=A0A1C7MBB6_GRIFR|nr:hypothetical protein A0H81_06076 [Grifola frondosa]
MWDQLPSYADATKTYEEWREEVKAFYPTADANRKYTLQDLDLLIGERSRLGISTAADLGDYYREFFKITEFLRSRQRLSTSEIARTFYKPFTPTLWQSVHSRLQLKYPDHNPDDFWPLRHILDAAHYVLHGTRVDAPAQGTRSCDHIHSITARTIKTEDFTSLIETVTRTIAQAFASQRTWPLLMHNHRRRESPILRTRIQTRLREVVTTAENSGT